MGESLLPRGSKSWLQAVQRSKNERRQPLYLERQSALPEKRSLIYRYLLPGLEHLLELGHQGIHQGTDLPHLVHCILLVSKMKHTG